MEEFEYKKEYQYLTYACLNLTDACNLACRYCFVEQHPHYMTLETAKKSADFLIKNLYIKREKFNYSEKEKVGITFFGGEPTLLWEEIIVPLVNYCNEKYPNEFNFTITTNGTLLNKERINFLKENNIFPLLSIDGAKRTQDFNRPCHNSSQSSFELVAQNIIDLLENFPTITFRSTIDQNTVQYLYENYLFAEFCGFKNWYAMPNCREHWTEKNVKELKNQYNKIYTYRILQFQNNIMPMNCTIIDDSFKRMAEMDIARLTVPKEIPNPCRTVKRCGMGTSGGSIGYNGWIYGCQEQPSRDEKNIFIIGDINNGINIEKHTKLLKEYNKQQIAYCENKEKCNNCQLRPICANYACPSTSWDLFNNFTINTEIGCDWLNMLVDLAINTSKILVKENNELFKNYLNHNCDYDKDYYIREDK